MNTVAPCFAKPLTDELLAQYQTLIKGLPAGQPLRSALQSLYACCVAWWNLPEPTGTETRTIEAEIPDKDGNILPKPVQVMMHKEHVATLFDLVPWDYELEAIGKLLREHDELLDKAAADRNGEADAAWKDRLERLLFEKQFPGEDRDVYLTAATMWKATINVLSQYGSKAAKRIADMQAQHDESEAGIAAWRKEVVKAVHPQGTPPIPAPVREPCDLRDCAYTLLWHAWELTKDREPITSDKL